MINTRGLEKKCVCCDEGYVTFLDCAMGQFCHVCRGAFNVLTSREGQEMIELLDGMPIGKRVEFRDEWKKKHPTPPSRQLQVAPPPAPKIDRAKVLAAQRAMIEYGRTIDSITPETPLEKPTSYVIAENGLFEVHDTDIGMIIAPATVVKGVEGKLKPGLSLNIPKIPYLILRQTVAFFRETCKRQSGSSEAYLQIWWNTQEKRYETFVPDQRVSGASVNHSGGFDAEGARTEDGLAIWLHVMDIHSHGSGMSAFWSSVDDADEKKAPAGRLFGVIGKVNQPLPDWKWRLRTREGFMELHVPDIFEVNLEEKVPFTITWANLMNAAGEKDGVDAQGRVKLSCPVDPFGDATCPDEWHARVNSGRSSAGSSHSSHGGEGWNASWRKPQQSSVLPAYIYIKAAGSDELEEHEVSADGVPKPTGHKLKLVTKEGNRVH
jgi:PRTRC genetic system protein A